MIKHQQHERKMFYITQSFIILTLVIMILFGLRIQIYDRNEPQDYANSKSIFLSLFMGLIFFIDAIDTKNIFQIKCYPRIILYSILLIFIDVIQENSKGYLYSVSCLVVSIFECILLYLIYGNLEVEYKWYFYKKYGLSEELQAIQRLKLELIVYYKVDIIINISSFLNRIVRRYKPFLEYTNIIALLVASIGFIGWRDCESYLNRGIVIFVYSIKIFVTLYEFISFFANYDFELLYVAIRGLYIFINDILLIKALISEVRSFGRENTEKLNNNIAKKRLRLE